MITDERITRTKNQIAATGFYLWLVLLILSLLYRQFYLQQSPLEYWDIALIFFIGTLYVALATYARGAIQETAIVHYGKWVIPIILASILLVNFFQGNISSLLDFMVISASALVTLLVIWVIFYLLYSRWEKRNQIRE
jgi:hypothetical protein